MVTNKMQTLLNKNNLSKILENAFIINRESTKHRKQFKNNTFERPISFSDFFHLLSKCSNIQLDMYECYRWSHNVFITNYVFKQKSTIKLKIYSSKMVMIESTNGYPDSIYLDNDKFFKMYPWFTDEMFSSDFGSRTHDDKYYQTLES
jgi:hypothetical protein